MNVAKQQIKLALSKNSKDMEYVIISCCNQLQHVI